MNKNWKNQIRNKKHQKPKKNILPPKNNHSSHNMHIKNKYNSVYLLQKSLFSKLTSKYNCTKEKYNLYIIAHILNNSNCRIVSMFKEDIMQDYIDEFLHRKYNQSESMERIPKFYKYYKNYLLFFCKPIFKDFTYNKIIQINSEKKAELYYKKKYLKSKSFEDSKDNGFEKTDSEMSSEKNSKNEKDGIIFNDTVKEKLENVTVLTTVSNGVNKSINLNIDNEKLEVFCENKYDKSNDTTVINFINNYKKEMISKKIKSNKKINHSYILANHNYSRNKYKSKIKATSYKLLINDYINDNLNDNINNFQNKKIKKKSTKKNSNKKTEKNDEIYKKKISAEKVKNYLRSYFTSLKARKQSKEKANNKKEKSKLKANISLKMIHKSYNKLEKELNNILINYRKNIKEKYNQISITTFSNSPYNHKQNIKSRNTNNNPSLYKQTSIYTGINGYNTAAQNKLKNSNYFNNKSYNLSSSNINSKKKKNIKFTNGIYNINSKNKNKKINNNISIKIENENENKILNNKSIKSKIHKDITYNSNNNYYYNNSKRYQTKNLIKIKRKDKLLKNSNESPNKQANILEIKSNTFNTLNKTNNNNNSKENLNLKMNKIRNKTFNKSRNYASTSSINNNHNMNSNLEDGYSSKKNVFKNKSINYNSTTNLNFKNKNKLIKKNIKNTTTNLMFISLPALNINNINNNKNKYIYNDKIYKKYISSFNTMFKQNNKKNKNTEQKNINSNNISKNTRTGSKPNKSKKEANSISKNKIKNKIDSNYNSSLKNNKYRTIISYNVKSISNQYKIK